MPIRRTALAVLSLAALALPLCGVAAQADGTPDPTTPDAPPFRLSMPEEATAYVDHGYTYLEATPRLVAGARNFELRATRSSYDQPISVSWVRPGADVQLPTGTMKQWGGLPDFVNVSIRDADDKGVLRATYTVPMCPGYDSQRVRPDAVAHNRYPQGCPFNPYTLGSVMGVPAGWAASLGGDEYGGELGGDDGLGLKPGSYTMTTQVAAKYRSVFGLTKPSDYTTSTDLTVVKGFECRRGCATSGAAGGSTPAPAARPAGTRPHGVSGRPSAGPRPDLRSLPAWGMQISRDGNYLQFAATVWNGGTSPLVVDGYRKPNNDPDHLDAYQYFFDKAGHQTGYQKVGEMEWDPRPSHNHWHFEDFAAYTLVTRRGGLVVKSEKEAFCLANTDAVDYTLPDADWRPEGTDLSTACGDHDSLAVREGLEVGSGDTYDQYRAGQSFDLRNVANGTYLVRVEANPTRNLVETDTSNDVADREVTIGGHEGHRTLKVAKVGIVSERGRSGGF